MEIKKSNKADLERRRPWLFLIGVVIASSLFFAVLNISINPPSGDVSPELLEEIAQEMELNMKRPDKDLIPVFPPEEKKEEESEILNIVDDKVETTDVNETAAESEGENEKEKTEPISPVVVDEKDKPLQFRIVEQLPEFPGGMTEFIKWLTKNLRYPLAAKHSNIEGRVVVSFIVNTDGSISNTRVARSAHPLLDKEALRVINMMPQWKAGEEMGKPCRTMISVPVVFKL